MRVRRRRIVERQMTPRNLLQIVTENEPFVTTVLSTCTHLPGCVTVSNTMTSNTTPDHDPVELGELERDILSIVWRMGNVTAEQVREELDRPLKDSTVRTVLRRLEEKGYLAHTLENRTFFYQPAESRQRVAGRAVKRIVDWFCEGSVEELLVGMVDSKVLDRAELQRLADRITAAQKNHAPGKKGV